MNPPSPGDLGWGDGGPWSVWEEAPGRVIVGAKIDPHQAGRRWLCLQSLQTKLIERSSLSMKEMADKTVNGR